MFSYGCGTVFQLASDGSETVLHNFRSNASGYPTPSNLEADAAGNLYGTISRTPPNPPFCFHPPCVPPSPGGAYEIRPGGAFRSLGTLPPEPSDLVIDALGNLYGETKIGGTGECAALQGPGSGTCGTVFKLIP